MLSSLISPFAYQTPEILRCQGPSARTGAAGRTRIIQGIHRGLEASPSNARRDLAAIDKRRADRSECRRFHTADTWSNDRRGCRLRAEEQHVGPRFVEQIESFVGPLSVPARRRAGPVDGGCVTRG